MSEIPLIWVKRWTQNNYHFVVFCEEQYDDTYKAYAHTDADGNVLPVTYFPMYEGSVVNNRMRSLSGLTPTASMTDEQETTAAKQNGDRWDKQSFSEINLMYEMCTMITCSTNSQGKFGNGNSRVKQALDVHLMVTEPIRYVKEFAKCGADIITVHLEACEDVKATVDEIKASGVKAACLYLTFRFLKNYIRSFLIFSSSSKI